MDMTGKERMETVLRGEMPDVCPAAPVFWGAEYVWKVTGRSLLEQMHGKNPGYPQAALALAARHAADWVLLSVTDGDDWLRGKEVRTEDGRSVIVDPVSGERFEYDPSAHLVRSAGKNPRGIPEQGRKEISSEKEVEALFPDSRGPHPDRHLAFISDVVKKAGEKIFVCACEISPFVDACYHLGAETAMQALGERPALFEHATRISLEIQRARIRSLRDTGVCGVLIAESYASCDMISPEQYRRFAFPLQKAVIDEIHEAGMYAVLDSTGYLLPILPVMAELGADGLVVEEGRKGADMEIGRVRELYGRGRCLFGNVSSEHLLATNDMRGVFLETERQIQAAGAKGAFAASNGASPICDSTSPVTIDIMIEAAHNHTYPAKAG
jgi:uroporphyrinogen-III decarboxylase